MARWKLTEPHYLNVPGTEWEYKETNQENGRQIRKVFPVPLLLNPDNPSDHNYKDEGIIVCHDGHGLPRDIVFIGPPTPSMEPLDDEAQNISAQHRPNWSHPIEDLPGQGFSQGLLDNFQRQLSDVLAKGAGGNVSMSGVSKTEFDELKSQLAQLMESNAKLQAQLVERPSRRV